MQSTSGRMLLLPYVKGLSESTGRTMRKYGRTCAFKPGNTLGQKLFRLKDKADSMKMADVTYMVQCKDCPGSHIGWRNYQAIGGQVKRALCQS